MGDDFDFDFVCRSLTLFMYGLSIFFKSKALFMGDDLDLHFIG